MRGRGSKRGRERRRKGERVRGRTLLVTDELMQEATPFPVPMQCTTEKLEIVTIHQLLAHPCTPSSCLIWFHDLKELNTSIKCDTKQETDFEENALEGSNA